MTPADTNWMAMLQKAVDEGTQTAVAKRLDVSRTTVSLILSGKYPGKTDRMAARVVRVFGQVQCTHTGQLIEQTVCVSYATRSVPLNNPLELSQWRACRNCRHYPASAKGAMK